MTNLPNSPLAYVIALVHFPALPHFTRFTGGFHELIRAEFPHTKSHRMPRISVKASPEGIQFKEEHVEMWQFTCAKREWAFIFGPSYLGLHTTRYFDHVSFIDRFAEGITKLISVEDINLAYCQSVGIRYVNQIVSSRKCQIEELVQPWALPTPAVNDELEIIDGIYVSRYKTKYGELRLQALKNPPRVLPPGLETELTQENSWLVDVPSCEFAIVDIDHGVTFDPLVPMDVRVMREYLYNLRKVAKATFERSATVPAMQHWRGESTK